MTDPFDAHDALPRARRCGSYFVGHEIHHIQAKLAFRGGPGVERTVQAVDDDGTITFVGGTTAWHHDPDHLRAAIARYGTATRLRHEGVLDLPTGEFSRLLFSVSTTPDPCRPETAGARPGESTVDELIRRGGFLRRGTDL